jgi:DNA-binding GntR family transcriptional regulator
MSSRWAEPEAEGVADSVAAELRRRIMNGQAPPGAVLNQSKLATELGVSRVPIRDALQSLAGTGLVVLNGRSGATVAPMSVSDLDEIFALRHTLEPLAARLAVPNLRRVDLMRMEQLAMTIEEAGDALEWVPANAAFHTALYSRAERPRLLALIATLRVLMERYFALWIERVGPPREANDQHRAIVAAAGRGDAEEVVRITAEHLTASYDALVRGILVRGLEPAPADRQRDKARRRRTPSELVTTTP